MQNQKGVQVFPLGIVGVKGIKTTGFLHIEKDALGGLAGIGKERPGICAPGGEALFHEFVLPYVFHEKLPFRWAVAGLNYIEQFSDILGQFHSM